MSGTGEYGVSVPNRYFYRLIESEEDANKHLDILLSMFDSFIDVKLKWNPIAIKRYSRARTWGLAHPNKSITLYSPMFGVLVHEITHVINMRNGNMDSHGKNFKDLLQNHWDILLAEPNYLKEVSNYRFHPIYYFNRVQRLCKNAGFEFDVYDDVAVTKVERGEVVGMFVGEVLSFIDEEKVWVKNKQNCLGSRYTEGQLYSVPIQNLDLPDTYYDNKMNVDDLPPEILKMLMKEASKNA